jgi:large subunit ribosomal protein L10
MAKTFEQKKQIVDKLVQNLKTAKLVVFSEIKGLNTKDTTQLRSELRKEQVKHAVVKLSLLKIAFNRLGIKFVDKSPATQVAVSFSEDDTAAARALSEFGKKNNKLKMLFGFLDKTLISSADLSALAAVPARPVLLSRLVSALGGPARGLVTVFAGSHRGLVQVLSQIKKQ